MAVGGRSRKDGGEGETMTGFSYSYGYGDPIAPRELMEEISGISRVAEPTKPELELRIEQLEKRLKAMESRFIAHELAR